MVDAEKVEKAQKAVTKVMDLRRPSHSEYHSGVIRWERYIGIGTGAAVKMASRAITIEIELNVGEGPQLYRGVVSIDGLSKIEDFLGEQ
tara:strand:+ start:1000 stop:1266 length:267 start_codon:yes stop_codon:yes gene_type:complete